MQEPRVAARYRGAVHVTAQTYGESAGGWFGADLLADLRHLNFQTVLWLRTQARQGTVLAQRSALLAGNIALWQALDDHAVEQLSLCPCALTDADFAHGASWGSIAATVVRDVSRAPARDPGLLLLGDAAGLRIARLTLQLAWHLARHRPVAATVTLGMAAQTAGHLQAMRMGAVDQLAEWLPGLVRPRWHADAAAWAHLLGAAIGGSPVDLELARVGALQRIAGQLRAVAKTVAEPEP